MGVAHPRGEIGSLSFFGTLIKCVGPREIKNVHNLEVGHCLRVDRGHLARLPGSER